MVSLYCKKRSYLWDVRQRRILLFVLPRPHFRKSYYYAPAFWPCASSYDWFAEGACTPVFPNVSASLRLSLHTQDELHKKKLRDLAAWPPHPCKWQVWTRCRTNLCKHLCLCPLRDAESKAPSRLFLAAPFPRRICITLSGSKGCAVRVTGPDL